MFVVIRTQKNPFFLCCNSLAYYSQLFYTILKMSTKRNQNTNTHLHSPYISFPSFSFTAHSNYLQSVDLFYYCVLFRCFSDGDKNNLSAIIYVRWYIVLEYIYTHVGSTHNECTSYSWLWQILLLLLCYMPMLLLLLLMLFCCSCFSVVYKCAMNGEFPNIVPTNHLVLVYAWSTWHT